jgi:hypothetical protein
MKAAFTLTSAESRRLIAKAVVAMDEVKRAREKAYVILAGGTTNGFVAQELLGTRDIRPERFTAGTSTKGVLCVTDDRFRQHFPIVLYKGQVVEKTITEALQDFHKETVVIKGANAVDAEGNVGVITSGFDGGTVAQVIGTVTSQGLRYIAPVGLEKLVPSVKAAARAVGARGLDHSLGADFGMYCLCNALVVTEIEALRILCGVKATLVGAGGVGGNEGAVTLVGEGDDKAIEETVALVESIKGEPPVPANKGTCATCRYFRCRYNKRMVEQLPAWLR